MRGLQIGTPFAEYDRDLALVVQAIAPFGIDELTIGTDESGELDMSDVMMFIKNVGGSSPK